MNKLDKLAEKLSALSFEIKNKKLEFLKIKEDLILEMILKSQNEKNTKFSLVKLVEYKSKYSPYLKKEFNNLDDNKKRELYKKDILKVFFRLNVQKYNELNEKDKKLINEYVRDKQNGFYNIYIKFNDEYKSELKRIKDDLFCVSEESEKILNEIDKERETNLNEEAQQKLSRYEEHLKDQFRDPNYLSNFVDDDPSEIIDTDYEISDNVGLNYILDSEEDDD